ncbi:hypothetical protein PLICRDRAFT_55241 [Plicaturopsis crispa FD-325 SS-3]|nr:hypothetical protein PLICRDRAFT_55241 [Plicaturopsis crispa FD-325 SS-3]
MAPTKYPSTETISLAARLPLPASPASSSILAVSARRETGDTSSPEPPPAETRRAVNESSLAPVDRGFGAMSFLAAAFFVEAIAWGFPNAFGVFLNAYMKDPVYASQKNAASILPLIGPLSSGTIYCSGVVINPVIARWPHSRQIMIWVGSLCCCASLFGASYTTKAVNLVIIQGFLYAIGGSLLYGTCISYMSEWFVKRRGLANGVIFAGTGAGGLVLPLVLPPLIAKFGPAKTLRYLSIAVLGMLLPLLPFVKGRLPASRVHGPAVRSSREWMKSRSFWMLIMANTIQGLGYFIPIIWLPTFASELHIGESKASLTVAFLNGASVVGRLSMGSLSDKFEPWLLALSGAFATSLATFVLWGVLSYSFAGLLVFSIAYGALATGWTSLYTGFIRPIAKDDHTLATTLFGYVLFSRGLGNILSTPIATSLYRLSPAQVPDGGLGFDVGGGRYEKMIIYVGTCFAATAAIAGVGWAAEQRRSSRAMQWSRSSTSR